MFGLKNSKNTNTAQAEKLSGPRDVPAPVQHYLVNSMKFDPDLARILKSVIRKKDSSDPKSKSFLIRIFDEGDALANKIKINNYLTLDEYTKLIIFEGWYDEATKNVELTEKSQLLHETPIYTEDEILKQIEAINQQGSSIFFYLGRGPTSGGPLGRGAAIVQINASGDGKKVKKYSVSMADVVDMKPVNQGNKFFDSDSAREVAHWIKDAHHKRMY
jgi:hypothetical protein